MPYKFELYADKAGKTRFRFVAPNGETMFSSQGYASKAGAKKSIESLKKNVPDADVTEAAAE
ncbi:MAG: YegP family protein [Rhodothermales bacterium]